MDKMKVKIVSLMAACLIFGCSSARITEKEFEKLQLRYKTPQEVLKKLGKPTGVTKDDPYADEYGTYRKSKESWRYRDKIRHELTGKDQTVYIYFNNQDGKVIQTDVR